MVGVDGDLSHGWYGDTGEGDSGGCDGGLGAGGHRERVLGPDEGRVHPLRSHTHSRTSFTAR